VAETRLLPMFASPNTPAWSLTRPKRFQLRANDEAPSVLARIAALCRAPYAEPLHS